MYDKTYYTVQEVATLLKLSALTVYKYIKERQLPVIDLGGYYRIEQSDLNRFIENHTYPATSQTEEENEI